jgi:sialate O-acetylesterase
MLKPCRVIIASCLLFFASQSSVHALELAAIFADGMVLQRGEPVPVWGWANPGSAVVVEFNDQKKTTDVGADGEWQVKLDAMQALTAGRKMVVVCGDESKTINDVVVGEVWFCSGQSNMTVWLGFLVDDPVKEKRYQPIVDYIQQEIETAKDPLLRQFQVGMGTSPFEKIRTGKGTWISSKSPADNKQFSGTGYFFAKELRAKLDVPVGIIKCDYGGTLIEPWIPTSALKAFPGLWTKYEEHVENLKKQCAAWESGETQRKYEEAVAKWEAGGKKGNKPFNWGDPAKGALNHCTLFNGMVYPVVPFAIKGVIWYQGESNTLGGRRDYAPLLEAMITGWRQEWSRESLPFYIAQLANHKDREDDGWMRVTDAQRRTAQRLAHTGLAVLNDVGEREDVHPKNKIDVGKRLALWALKQDYNLDVPTHSGPLYKSHEAKGGHLLVTFDHSAVGLMVGRKNLLDAAKEVDEPLRHFEISGVPGDWQPAQAEIVAKDTVKVWSDKVSRPHGVRYAWKADLDGPLLYNREGLPASIFSSEPDLKAVALRSADQEALFRDLKQTYGITAVLGTTTKPEKLPVNVAMSSEVTASSVFEDQAAKHAIDGNLQTGWASAKDGRDASMVIRFGRKYRITHIGYRSRNGVFERVESFKVAFADGGLQVCYLQEAQLQTGFQYFDIDDVETDLVRWSVLDTKWGGNTGAMEIAIYGAPAE